MNMRHIAVRAGVSSATVSRVINGSALVSEATAKRVRAVLEAENFIPNPVATTLKYGRSKTYGLLIPDIRNPFFSEFLGEFEELLAEIDHELLLTCVESSPDKLVRSMQRMLARRVDGAVLMSSEFETKAIEPLFKHKVPIVTVDRQSVHDGCSDVSTDFEKGFEAAVMHLRQRGHRRIAFIGGSKGLLTSDLRLGAFKAAMKTAGLAVAAGYIRVGNYKIAGGEQAGRELMALKEPPTAIMTANDLTAYGAIRSVHSMGLTVPGDVSVIGVDDLLLNEITEPPLTSIRIPRRRMAEQCLSALESIKQDVEQMGTQFHVATELVERGSTGAARA